LTDKTTPERGALLGAIQREFPQAVVRLAVTYYTGKADTVPHIPERCMVADGYQPVDPQTLSHPADTYADAKPRQVAYRFTRFEDQSEMRRVSRNVAYCFHVNGHYESDPLGV